MYSVDDDRCFGHILATAFSCGCVKTWRAKSPQIVLSSGSSRLNTNDLKGSATRAGRYRHLCIQPSHKRLHDLHSESLALIDVKPSGNPRDGEHAVAGHIKLSFGFLT